MKRSEKIHGTGFWLLIIVIVMVLIGGGWYLGKHSAKKQYQIMLGVEQKKLSAVRKTKKEIVSEKSDNYLQNTLENKLRKKHYVGTAIIAYHGEIVARYFGGYSNYQKKIKNTIDTSFEINSIQKSMTASLIMKQVNQGKLKLTDKLSKFYPEVEESGKITINQLLDMSSGLTMKGMGTEKYINDEMVISSDIKRTKFSTKFYNKFSYQSINFVLLVGILEKVTGRSYQQLFTEQYIRGLNLSHTAFGYQLPSSLVTATGYDATADKTTLAYTTSSKLSENQQHRELGTGQVFMSVSDLYKTCSSMFNGQTLSKTEAATLFDNDTHYSGGYYNSGTFRYSNGGGVGYQAAVHISRDGQNAIILMTNYYHISRDTGALMTELNPIVFGTSKTN